MGQVNRSADALGRRSRCPRDDGSDVQPSSLTTSAPPEMRERCESRVCVHDCVAYG
eukprot:CAMPEP_0181235632 /NCGR_PEP_ID=MMETSP1096-20121128/37688_1 /TAXON_ID=156174 ORGANISM="Chrysochromulina ericina, Strain CCMP281" /NCGR_SAMPLE_ID=MMETSP1096 /ASSEMBLY_ACC=CAM_ASM_000453 /LENGTH=55 /DNA_ID=CAMNT_0023330643 /DNA_START=319 /DNA_END=483 /DNA_ORIENTATION=+